MSTWAICSIFLGNKAIQVKSTEEFDLSWISKTYGEKAFLPITVQDGVFKSHSEYHTIMKRGATYPYWVSNINLSHSNDLPLEQKFEFAGIEWEIIHYFLSGGWEPFSFSNSVEGDGVGAGFSLNTVRQKVFRKQIS